MRKIALLLTVLSGCFNPDLSKANIICDVHFPECRDPAQVCNFEKGRCEDPPPVLQPDGGIDSAGPASLQLGPTPACKSGTGYTHPDHPNIAACPGSWLRPFIYDACGAGWRMCTSAPEAFCAALPAFFAAPIAVAQSSSWPPDANLRCTWDGSAASSPRGIAGCGVSPRGGTYPASAARCNGLLSVQSCGNSWRCPQGSMPSDQDFVNLAMDNEEDGRLCCKG